MANFDNLLSNLHNMSALTDGATDNTEMLIINEKRQITFGKNFDPVIAYEGDINSQVITIESIRYWDGHDLSLCTFKELKWKNKVSGNEGVSKLSVSEENEEKVYFKWEVPSDACTQAGTLEISITLYDKSNNYVVFSWNTALFSGLSIGKSIESVNFDFPPKDEILIIDKDTKAIVSPVGYNNTICNYGDVGVTEVYFSISRYLGKNRDIDIMNENTIATIYITLNGMNGTNSEVTPEGEPTGYITKKLYTEELDNRLKEGLVLLTWMPPAGVTAGPGGPNTLSIAIGFESDNKKWFSNIYSKLTIGNNMFATSGEPGEPGAKWIMSEDYVKSVINNEYINGAINKYIEDNDFVIG